MHPLPEWAESLPDIFIAWQSSEWITGKQEVSRFRADRGSPAGQMEFCPDCRHSDRNCKTGLSRSPKRGSAWYHQLRFASGVPRCPLRSNRCRP